MLGKGHKKRNNQGEKNYRYSLRKYSFGVVSVAISATVFFGGGSNIAIAQENPPETVVESNASDAGNANDNLAQEKKSLEDAVTKLGKTLETSVSLEGMTDKSIEKFKIAQREATILKDDSENIMTDKKATAEQIKEAKEKIDRVTETLKEAIKALTLDKSELLSKVKELESLLNENISGKTPSSKKYYEEVKNMAQGEFTKAKELLENNSAILKDITEEVTKLKVQIQAVKEAKVKLIEASTQDERTKAKNDANGLKIASDEEKETMKPSSVEKYNKVVEGLDTQIKDLQMQSDEISQKGDEATKEEVSRLQLKIDELKQKLTDAKSVLIEIADKTKLNEVLENLYSNITEIPDLSEITAESVKSYNKAVEEAKKILDEKGKLLDDDEIDSDVISVAITDVEQEDNALSAAKKNLEIDKKIYKSQIEKLTSLNQAQRNDLNKEIDEAEGTAEHKSELSDIIKKATDLNEAMYKLKELIADENIVENSRNFTEADEEKQDIYRDAIENAEVILVEEYEDGSNKEAIEEAIIEIEAAKKGLNGEALLADEKQKTKNKVDSELTGLNKSQKKAITDKIDGVETRVEVASNYDEAVTLNDKMNELKELIEKNKKLKTKAKYTNADGDKKIEFENVMTEAENLLSKVDGNNANKEKVDLIIKYLKDAAESLNGQEIPDVNRELEEAKTTAKTKLEEAAKSKIEAINTSDAKSEDKAIAIKKVENFKKDALDKISDATNKDNAKRALDAGVNNISSVSIPKTEESVPDDVLINADKDKAKAEIEEKAKNIIKEIEKISDLNNDEKNKEKDKINVQKNSTVKNIENATTMDDINLAKIEGSKKLDEILKNVQDKASLNKAKKEAKYKIEKEAAKEKIEIQGDKNIGIDEKLAKEIEVDREKNKANIAIDNANDLNAVDSEEKIGIKAINDVHTIEDNHSSNNLVGNKEAAKEVIEDAAEYKKDTIDKLLSLTKEEKYRAKKEIDDIKEKAVKEIDSAMDKLETERYMYNGLNKIVRVVIWKNVKSEIAEMPTATDQEILVSGKVIVKQGEKITSEMIKNHMNLYDFEATVISIPSTEKISDKLFAVVEVILKDGSKVSVNVPVVVREKQIVKSNKKKDNTVNEVNKSNRTNADKNDKKVKSPKTKDNDSPLTSLMISFIGGLGILGTRRKKDK